MKKRDLINVINQIKKYNLTQAFEDKKAIKLWLYKLNDIQINNFLSLNIDSRKIGFPLGIIINENLLNCLDYCQRIEAVSKIKNGGGYWGLFDELCKPNFVKSKNFYADLEMLNKVDTSRHGLRIIGQDTFINSPYHNEDLKLIVETHDTKDKKPLDFLVSDALATVAGNIDSINSPYHQADMKLIAESGSDCLQISNSYPKSSLNNLAVNPISLNDAYHLENMKILAKNPTIGKFLYIIMTDPNIIKGKNYRKEVESLVNAKSLNTARAIYYYIVNPEAKFRRDRGFYNNYKYDCADAYIIDNNSVAGNKSPDYLEKLTTLNEIPDKFIMHYVSLLMNSTLINSPYLNDDLELLKKTVDKPIFMDLYGFITDETSLKNPFHNSDAKLLSTTYNAKIRELILEKITDKYSLENPNRSFDLKYISSLDLDNIDKKIFDQMSYYLFVPQGIDAEDHVQALEKLYQGIYAEPTNQVLNYLDTLEQHLNDSDTGNFIATPDKKKTKILSLFKKYGKK